MQIPCTYDNDTLFIKALNIRGQGWPREEAFFNALKASPELYGELCAGTIHEHKEKLFILVPYSTKLYDRIIELEPLPTAAEQKKLKKNNLLKPTTEEVLKYGYNE